MGENERVGVVMIELKGLYKRVTEIAEYLGDRREFKASEDCSIIDEILQEIEDINSRITYIAEETNKLK